MTVAEPAVTLTDFALALKCLVLTALIATRATSDETRRKWIVVFFGSLTAAPLLGGIVHGFITDKHSLAHAIFWNATLIAIGVTALATWMIVSLLSLRGRGQCILQRAAIVIFALYTASIIGLNNSFYIAVVHYLPPALIFTAVVANLYRKSRTTRRLAALTGLLMTFAAALVQQLKVAVHPEYFDHNALYHLIQGVAVLLIFVWMKAIVEGAE